MLYGIHLQAITEWETDITARLVVSEPSLNKDGASSVNALPLHALPLLWHCQPETLHSCMACPLVTRCLAVMGRHQVT